MSQRGRGAQCPLCQCVAGRGALCAACINSAAAPQRAALAGLQAQRQALHDRLAQLLAAKARRFSLAAVGAGQGAREPARLRPTNAAAARGTSRCRGDGHKSGCATARGRA
jgi:hypothetical protein